MAQHFCIHEFVHLHWPSAKCSEGGAAPAPAPLLLDNRLVLFESTGRKLSRPCHNINGDDSEAAAPAWLCTAFAYSANRFLPRQCSLCARKFASLLKFWPQLHWTVFNTWFPLFLLIFPPSSSSLLWGGDALSLSESVSSVAVLRWVTKGCSIVA